MKTCIFIQKAGQHKGSLCYHLERCVIYCREKKRNILVSNSPLQLFIYQDVVWDFLVKLAILQIPNSIFISIPQTLFIWVTVMITTDTYWIFIVEHQQKSYLHFVEVGWSLFSRSQQHSQEDGNDEEGKDSSNYSSSYGYRRGLLKWNICKVTKIRFFKQSYKEFSNSCPLISTMCKRVIQPQAQKPPNLMLPFNVNTLFARCNFSTPTLLF